MTDLLEYRGYQGSVDFSADDDLLFGKVLFIDSLILYHGSSVAELRAAFHEAVDRYLLHCEEQGKSPNKPYSGTFNVRLGPDLHRSAAIEAARHDKTLNEFIKGAVHGAVDCNNRKRRSTDEVLKAPLPEGVESLVDLVIPQAMANVSHVSNVPTVSYEAFSLHKEKHTFIGKKFWGGTGVVLITNDVPDTPEEKRAREMVESVSLMAGKREP